MSLCQREGFGNVSPVSEIGKKGAVAEQFTKPASSVLSKEDFLCGAPVCWIWPSWIVRLPVLLSVLCWEPGVQWGNSRRVVFSGVTFLLTIENSKILCNAQRRLAPHFRQCIQTVQHASNCIWHCFVCMKGKVKHLTLVLGEIALKYISKLSFWDSFWLDCSGWIRGYSEAIPSLCWQRRDYIGVTRFDLGWRGCLCEIALQGISCRLLYEETYEREHLAKTSDCFSFHWLLLH